MAVMAVPGLLGERNALAVAEQVIKKSPGELTEVVLRGGVSNLTRFTDNYIHQNVAETNQSLTVRVIFGKKIGAYTTNSLDPESIERAVQVAAELAKMQQPNPEFEGLPEPSPIQKVDSFYEETCRFSATDRAMAVKTIIDVAKSAGFRAAGAFSTGVHELCVANSLGVRAYNASTVASVRTVVMSDSGSGYAESSSMRVSDIIAEDVARRATEKCRMAQNPVSAPPGEYEVVLEPLAVSDMLGYVVRAGFSAQAVREGRSFLCGKLGEKLFSHMFTMWDDGLDPRGFPVPFDLEGVPKRKVVMVENGVARELLYDFRNAKKEGKQPTGHGGFGGFGPMATNLFMAPGTSTIEEMIRATKRGILVTRFHYTNMAHPSKVLITGMTRDGTFLIEDGQITRPVRNMRFTESALRVFGTMDMVGDTTVRAGRAVVPAIRVPAFNFTGVTEF